MNNTTHKLVCLVGIVLAWETHGLAQMREQDDTPIAEHVKPRTPIDPAGPEAPQTLGDAVAGAVSEVEAGGRGGSFVEISFDVDKFLAGCLLAANEGEIAISELAANRAKSLQVKEYAQQMVEEHRGLSRQLKSLAVSNSEPNISPLSPRGNVPAATDHSGKMTDVVPKQSIGSEPNQQVLDSNAPPRNALPARAAAADENAGFASTDASHHGRIDPLALGPANLSLYQLADADRRNHQAVTKRMRIELEQVSVDDFDATYLHGQAVAQIEMIGATEAIQQQSPGQLGQIAKQANAMGEQHLKQVKQLLESHAKVYRDTPAKSATTQ